MVFSSVRSPKNWLDSMFSRRLFIGHLNVFAGGIHMFESQWNDVSRIFLHNSLAASRFSCRTRSSHCHINHLSKLFIIQIIENMLCWNWSLYWNLWPNFYVFISCFLVFGLIYVNMIAACGFLWVKKRTNNQIKFNRKLSLFVVFCFEIMLNGTAERLWSEPTSSN